MSVIVKGMKMPKKCLDCPFMISRDNDDCIVQSNEANAKFDSWDDMKADCPLIEVKTPHGRLIDADAIDFHNDKMHDGTGNLVVEDNFINGVLWINDSIDNTPTIIEAEGEE